MSDVPETSPTFTVAGLEVLYLILDGGPIACPYCGYITRPSVSHCPRCGCLMRLHGGEIRYPGIDADYKAQHQDPAPERNTSE